MVCLIAGVDFHIAVLHGDHLRAPPAALLRAAFIVAFPADGVRGGRPDFPIPTISFSKLDVLVEPVAFKVILKHEVPSILPKRRQGEVIGFVFPAVRLLFFPAAGEEQAAAEQTGGHHQRKPLFHRGSHPFRRAALRRVCSQCIGRGEACQVQSRGREGFRNWPEGVHRLFSSGSAGSGISHRQ